VKGYAIKQPYTFSVPTNFGRIVDFAKDFSEDAASSRPLEYFTIASMLFSSNAADGEPLLPTTGILTDCGKVIHRSPKQVSNALEDIISYTLADILWWQKMPASTEDPKVYAIQDLNGNKFQDLEIGLYLPDDFEIPRRGPVVITNTRNLIESSISFFNVPVCLSYYNQKYSVAYPVVFRIKDELTENYFHFSSLVFVDNKGAQRTMEPGSCGNFKEGIANPCGELDCNGKVKVTDYSGNPLEGAFVMFGSCSLGDTDSEGVVEAPILCGKENLSVYYKDNYEFYLEGVNSGNIEPADNKVVMLHRKPLLNIKFFELGSDCTATPLENEMISGFVNISSGGQSAFSNTDLDGVEVPENCDENPGDCIGVFDGHLSSEITVDYMPAGEVYIETWITNPKKQKEYKDILIPSIIIKDVKATIPEEDSILNYYIPSSEAYVDESAACIDGDGIMPLSICSPNIIPCSGSECLSTRTRAERVIETYDYMTIDVPAGFKALLKTCGKEMVEI
jgi:hypothetical protein